MITHNTGAQNDEKQPKKGFRAMADSRDDKSQGSDGRKDNGGSSSGGSGGGKSSSNSSNSKK